MNERIRELVEQAGMVYWPNKELDRFAELIVRECAGLVKGQPHFDKMLDCATVIKQHFGVEE